MANAVGPKTERASIAEEALLSRSRFLDLCVASVVGLLLLVLAGCGGGGGNGKKDKKDDGGGGGGGGGY